jgi:protein required for attachment to host cells
MATGQGTTWVLVSDAHQAHVLEVEDAGLAPRLRTTLHADAEGAAVGPGGPAAGALGHGAKHQSAGHGWMRDNPSEIEERRFAHSLVRVLERGLADNHFKHLVLVAPPRMLGLLRESLTRGVADRVRASEHKDWSHLGDRELAEHVRALVEIWPQA